MHNCVVKKPEILAPAGNMESLRFAVNNGANAVYLGLRNYSARSKAGNFSFEELKDAIEYAHFYNVRIYLAVNTIYKTEEKEQLFKDIQKAYNLGIDAIIIQDLTILPQIRSIMPDIIVHFSTQAGIHNVYGAKIAEKLGADRIILSREVTIEDIKEIKANCNVEIECFVQGALCISFSGNCYFSSLVSGFSGNRGKCLQLCRKPYVINGKEKYWLSAKDLCMLSHIKELQEAGIDSFKIEGRMRRPEYVGEAVNAYKRILDGLPYDISNLEAMYNRGDYCTAHLFNPTENVIYPHIQGHIGKKIGKIVSLKGNKAILSAPVKKGDAIKFIANNNEVGTALITENGNSTTYVGKPTIGSEVRLTTDKELVTAISERKIFVPINVDIDFEHNKKIHVKVYNNRASIDCFSDFITQNALKSPISNADLKEIFSKCKDFGFEAKNVNISNDGLSFVVKSMLNAFRRNVFEEFFEIYKLSYQKPVRQNNKFEYDSVYAPTLKQQFPPKAIFAETDKFEFIEDLLKKCDYVAYSPRSYKEFCNKLDTFNQECFLKLPPIARGKDLKILEEIAKNDRIINVIAENIYSLELFKDKNILLGSFCNIIDKSFPSNKILSVEGGISPNDFVYSYGRYPIMTFSHCPKKTLSGSCKNCAKYDTIDMIDERGNTFTYSHYEVSSCYSQLLNSLPIDLSGINAKSPINKVYLDLKGKTIEECDKIINCFKNKTLTNEKGMTAFCNKTLE
ncbi:MAG: U32 family peptidase [Clostridiales bacterium]|nr:U32 family peptidase [Clostridiales bacterium]